MGLVISRIGQPASHGRQVIPFPTGNLRFEYTEQGFLQFCVM